MNLKSGKDMQIHIITALPEELQLGSMTLSHPDINNMKLTHSSALT
jgi:hypothetical protein